MAHRTQRNYYVPMTMIPVYSELLSTAKCKPEAPTAPSCPVGPGGPDAPFKPSGPGAPVNPVSPVSPAGPTLPCAPVKPVAPLPPSTITNKPTVIVQLISLANTIHKQVKVNVHDPIVMWQ